MSGRSPGTFFREEVAGPLGLDFWIGLPEEIEPRVAPTLAFQPTPEFQPSAFHIAAVTEPESAAGLMMLNSGGYLRPGEWDSRAAHASDKAIIASLADAAAAPAL